MRRKDINLWNAFVCSLCVVLLMIGCASTPAKTPEAMQIKRILEKYVGPKKRIAVAKFDATGGFVAHYGGYDIGGGLASMLATELVKTGRFVVVERTDLASVLREQELGAVKISTEETSAKIGKILGAQLLVRGSVTEFEAEAGGGGLRLGGGLPLIGGALSGRTRTAHVGIDLRLIDTTTGQVVLATRAEAKARETGFTADVTQLLEEGKFSIGGDAYMKTPLGKATREAIDTAIDIIITEMAKIPWTAHVVDYDEGQVYVNAGSELNLKVGDRFVVFRTTKKLIDPSTGAVLGQIKDRLGEIEVQSIQPKFAIARTIGDFAPARGDLVKFPE